MIRAFLCAFTGISFAISASQCNAQRPVDPAPAPISFGGTAPAPTLGPIPPATGDRCSVAFTRITVMGCALPADWLDACVAARLGGSTFHLSCFDGAQDCATMAACLNVGG